MPKAIWADAPNARIAIAFCDDLCLAAIFEARELKLIFDDIEKLIELELEFEGVFAGLIAGLPRLATLLTLARDWRARLALALAQSAAFFVGEAEARELNPRDGDLHGPLSLAPHEVFMSDIFFEVLAD